MKYVRCVLSLAASAALFVACAHGGSNGSNSTGAGGAAATCPPCQQDSDCAPGWACGQFGGDTYCAPDCSTAACTPDRTCTPTSGADGSQDQLCLPNTNACGTMPGMGGSPSTGSTTSSSSGNAEICGSLDGPDIMAKCTSCKTSGMPCQANGCYGGWWCNTDTNSCQAPPSPSSCGTTGSSSSSSSSSTTSSGTTSPIGPTGGTLSTLSFAIVGDTRPPTEDDVAGYPTAVITKIWQDIQATSPRPPFAISTGDYQFAGPTHTPGTQTTQINTYLTARAAFANIVFPAMGNHECDGATQDNCYACGSACNNVGGSCIGGLCQTPNYTVFLSKMLQPVGQNLPYYTINVNGTGNAWTSKFVFVACNMWSSTQASWLSSELAKPTTYTFVVRHEGTTATTAPCLATAPTADTIIGMYPHTLLIAGHTHTFAYYSSEKQMIVGNGGAPLTGSVNYGYVIGTQQPNGQILFKSYDYSTNAVVQSFNVNP